MSCYHPLLGVPDYDIRTGGYRLTKNKKIKYRVIKVDDYDNDILLHDDGVILIPCGKCIGCRLDYSREWANRLILELQYHDSAYFVTLTYNDEHVPISYYPDPETGEAYESLTLCKRDVQLFMKRLRKAFPNDKIRFYLAGEYGDETFRPHYHAIIFGLHLTDGYPWRYNREEGKNFVYYRSPSLERCWSVKDDDGVFRPIGHVEYADVCWETCAYTARYVTKKFYGEEAEFYEKFQLVPPFSLMSRKPGIGRLYYDDHPEMFEYDFLNISTERGGLKFMPPKYFERLYELDFPDEAEQRKETRKAMAKAAIALKLQQSTKSYGEILQTAEDVKKSRTKRLRRDGVD